MRRLLFLILFIFLIKLLLLLLLLSFTRRLPQRPLATSSCCCGYMASSSRASGKVHASARGGRKGGEELTRADDRAASDIGIAIYDLRPESSIAFVRSNYTPNPISVLRSP